MAAVDSYLLGDQASASPPSAHPPTITAKPLDFHNGRLRLSAYLRVIYRLPGRPKRCRRHANSLNEPPSGSRKLSEAPAMDHETHMLSTVTTESPTNKDASVAGDRSSSSCTLQRRDETRTNEQDPESLENQLPEQQENFPIARSEQPEQPIHSESTQRKRPVPVNTLALTRAMTEAGLPLPGDAGAVLAPSIMEVDPIQDTQIEALQGVAKKQCLSFGTHSPRIRTSTNMGRSTKFKRDWASVRDPERCKRLNAVPLAHLLVRVRELRGVPDGFVGGELTIPTLNTQRHIKNSSGRRIERPKNVTDNRMGQLQLVEGHLPLSHVLSVGAIKPENGSRAGFLLPQNAVANDERQQGSPSPADSSIVEQLANVTAPARTDEDTDYSSDSEERRRFIENWDLEDDSDQSQMRSDYPEEEASPLFSDDVRASGRDKTSSGAGFRVRLSML